MNERQRHTLRLCAVVLGMFGFGFALGPLYSALCKITGFNGQWSGMATVEPEQPVAVDTSRQVKVLFVTTVNGTSPWEFKPVQASVMVHPGELRTVDFIATNLAADAKIGQAVPNVAPWEASKHLRKTECFCFNNQSFAALEKKNMPVRFMLDPALPPSVDTVTLSYTFFDVTQTAAQSAALPKS